MIKVRTYLALAALLAGIAWGLFRLMFESDAIGCMGAVSIGLFAGELLRPSPDDIRKYMDRCDGDSHGTR